MKPSDYVFEVGDLVHYDEYIKDSRTFGIVVGYSNSTTSPYLVYYINLERTILNATHTMKLIWRPNNQNTMWET